MIKRLDHVCIAVNNLGESVALFERTMGLKCGGIVDVPELKHKEAFFKVGEGELNLVGATAPDGSIAEFLDKHGEGVHHICFEVDDVDKEVEAMEREGVKIHYPHEREPDGRMGYASADLESTYGVLIQLMLPRSEIKGQAMVR